MDAKKASSPLDAANNNKRPVKAWKQTVRDLLFVLMLASVAFSTALAVAGTWEFVGKDASFKMHCTTLAVFTGGIVACVLMVADTCDRNFVAYE